MRILVINWQDRLNPQAGGAEVHLHEIFRRLADRGHRVQLLVSGWPGAPASDRVDGLDVRRVGGRHTFPLRVRSAYRRLRERERFDLVVEDINKLPLFTPLWVKSPVVALIPHLFGATAFREAGWPVAGTVWLAERLMPAAYRSTPVQAISRSTADDLERRGFERSRVTVIYPGIDHSRFFVDPEVQKYEVPTIVYVGRLKRYKGLDVTFRALRLLTERWPQARFLIAGQGDDRVRLNRVARREGVTDNVRFLGFVSEGRKLELLRRAWVNVYPSPKEGWGITNVEAAACGTPTVASDSPGLRESVRDGSSGYLVPHSDATRWASALGSIFRDDSLRQRLSREAIRFSRRFSWEEAADQTERALVRQRLG
ncbi:MAG: glycosyltransferase family 4 protein [Gemmatimonadota bacterium]